MSDSVEYRVRWRREGRQTATRIYQTRVAAMRKAEAVLALEQVKGEAQHWETMPDLAEPPVIQTRPVGDWNGTVEYPSPSDAVVERVRQWAVPYDDDGGYGPF